MLSFYLNEIEISLDLIIVSVGFSRPISRRNCDNFENMKNIYKKSIKIFYINEL